MPNRNTKSEHQANLKILLQMYGCLTPEVYVDLLKNKLDNMTDLEPERMRLLADQ